MKILLGVALGGAIGAAARYLISGQFTAWFGTGIPWGTLSVNVLGSFILGVFIETSALMWSPDEFTRAFLTLGVLGGFTTFSAFSMDVVLLAERGRLELAGLYVLASVALALAGLFAGLRLTRLVIL